MRWRLEVSLWVKDHEWWAADGVGKNSQIHADLCAVRNSTRQPFFYFQDVSGLETRSET